MQFQTKTRIAFISLLVTKVYKSKYLLNYISLYHLKYKEGKGEVAQFLARKPLKFAPTP